MQKSYSAAAKLLHWAMALFILCQLAVGSMMIFLPKGPFRGDVYDTHKQVGVLLVILFVVRIVLRLAQGAPPAPASMPEKEQRLAGLGHLGLYLLMIATPVAGIVLSQAGAHPVHFLGLTLPELVGKSEALHELGENGHLLTAIAIGTLVLLHAGAALRHHYVLKDEVLRRMLPGRAA